MSSTDITLIVTGGTLDKDYQTTSGELVFSKTHLATLLSEANSTLNIEPQVVLLKDSLEMTDADRKKIEKACIESLNHQIIITHGTDTMVETGLFLQSSPELTLKTIVLTGAMRPYMLGKSDASFNVGSATTACQLLKPGVFITMNGRIFPINNVTKNTSHGVFEFIETLTLSR